MSAVSFAPVFRLRQSGQYQHVFKSGQRFVRRGLVVIAAPVIDASSARLGLAIAKKRLPLAVDRNRVKRVIRESFRLHRKHLPAYDIVVLARNSTRKTTNKKLYEQLSSIWQELAKSSP